MSKKNSNWGTHRILKAKGNINIETLQRAAVLVSCELRLDLV